MIWYKFHLGDYITHTLHLADAEDLAYRRLLDMYYMNEEPIPLDTELVSRKIRLDQDITETVLKEFFDKEEDGYHNSRCDAEIAKYQAQVATNRELGKRGGRPKKASNVIKLETEVETESEPNHNPKKIQIQNKNISSRFDEFWSVWPSSKRKVAKVTCKAKWDKNKLDAVADQIIAHVETLRSTEQWTSGFDPAPLTYLNQRRWEDQEVAAPHFNRRVV